VTAVRPDADALRTLAAHVGRQGQEVSAARASAHSAPSRARTRVGADSAGVGRAGPPRQARSTRSSPCAA
jgi:hypothetical protein